MSKHNDDARASFERIEAAAIELLRAHLPRTPSPALVKLGREIIAEYDRRQAQRRG